MIASQMSYLYFLTCENKIRLLFCCNKFIFVYTEADISRKGQKNQLNGT